MKKIILSCIITLSLITILSTSAYAQSLYVDAHVGDLKKIDNSKYIATAVSVLRDIDGNLISVVKTDATRYLEEPVTDQFIDTLPVIKKGSINERNVEMTQVSLNYNYEKCIPKTFDVPGYFDECNWYHRATATSLGINDEVGNKYEIFRGLNHSYVVKPSDSVTSHWTIIRTD